MFFFGFLTQEKIKNENSFFLIHILDTDLKDLSTTEIV